MTRLTEHLYKAVETCVDLAISNDLAVLRKPARGDEQQSTKSRMYRRAAARLLTIMNEIGEAEDQPRPTL